MKLLLTSAFSKSANMMPWRNHRSAHSKEVLVARFSWNSSMSNPPLMKPLAALQTLLNFVNWSISEYKLLMSPMADRIPSSWQNGKMDWMANHVCFSIALPCQRKPHSSHSLTSLLAACSPEMAPMKAGILDILLTIMMTSSHPASFFDRNCSDQFSESAIS